MMGEKHGGIFAILVKTLANFFHISGENCLRQKHLFTLPYPFPLS